MKTYQHLKLDYHAPVLNVTLNRADVHNAFNHEMIAEITDAFVEAKRILDLRVVVLRGEGKSFSAGGDLNWMKSMLQYTQEQNIQDAQKLFDMFDTIASCPVPVVGHVQGAVFGGGLGLTSVCDMVAAEVGTKFCFSEVKIGLAPATISPFVLRKVGEGFARELMLSGDVFLADRAKEIGLVHFVGTHQDCVNYVDQKIKSFKEAGPQAVRATKELFSAVRGEDWKSVRATTAKLIAERRVSVEGQEGLKGFLEKKAPSWKL